AFAINAAGDIAGYTFPVDNDYPGGQSFVLRRKRWVVGQPVAPPLQALTGSNIVYRQPMFQATDGTPPEQVAQATLWAPKEQKFYFLRPIQGELTWYTTDNLLATNAPVLTRRGKAVWPDRPQIHVATAPVSLEPADGSTPYRAIQLSYSEVPSVTY